MHDLIRHAALSILTHIEDDRHTLDHLIDETLDALPETSRRDRNFIYALTHGTLRWRGRLDWVLAQVSKTPLPKIDPVIRNILRLGLFQVLFMDRIPASAAVNTAVELSKAERGAKVTGFVNAVLRNAIRRKDTIRFPNSADDPVGALSARLSFSPWMIKRWHERMGHDETVAMCEAINTLAPLTLRVNTLKTDCDSLATEMCAVDETIHPTPYSPLGLQMNGTHPTVTALPGFHTGAFQVQDEAAQLVTFLLDTQPGERILDAGAGLGGKTGHIAQQMQNAGQIMAVDIVSAKLDRLSQEMKRLGAKNVVTQQVDLHDAAAVSRLGFFDRILLDAPCSGLGVLRRHPDGKWRHGRRALLKMAQRQIRFLDHLAEIVKPGGILVYSVCSTEPEENKEVINHFLTHHPNFSISPVFPYLPSSASDLATSQGFFRTLVHRHQMDGFFAARLLKS